jgi:hypothetical protein
VVLFASALISSAHDDEELPSKEWFVEEIFAKFTNDTNETVTIPVEGKSHVTYGLEPL